tara:strand:- start:1031 stop:2290 length:1260 start_codon:yes stop_codon:yes gene_type:complete
MSTTLAAITNANTFGIWKDRTNQIITALGGVVTIGNSETNAGNIVIGGDITSSGTIFANTLDATSSGSNLITMNANFKLNGELALNTAGATLVKYHLSDVLTWSLGTNASHSQFKLLKGSKSLTIDSVAGTINGVGLAISDDLLPASISSDITGNAATASKWAAGRTVTFDGSGTDVTGNFTIDGSGNVSNVVLTVVDDSHNHIITDIDDLDTTLNGFAPTTGATFTGDVLWEYGDRVRFGSSTQGSMNMQYSNFVYGGVNVPNVFQMQAADGSGAGASLFHSMVINKKDKYLYLSNGTTLKTSFGGGSTGGDIVTVGDITAFGTVSDIRRKENIVKIDNALDKISKVSGYTYNYKGDKTPMTGVIAQEFEEILPEVVYETKMLDGTTSKAVRHGNIVGLLIESIKELKAEIEELKKDK